MAADPRLIQFARRMRRKPTPAEGALWQLLRNRQLVGCKFRRQHPVGLYIADFYSASAALVVELDGDSHTTPEGQEHDRIRYAYLRALGLEVVRFRNPEVADNADGVLEQIARLCEERRGLRRLQTPVEHQRVRATNSGPGE
jgi:very-short-patch-repair endonuclease